MPARPSGHQLAAPIARYSNSSRNPVLPTRKVPAMSWPAKYFTTPAEPDAIAAAVGSVFPYGEPFPPDDVPARGFQGFDAAFQYNLKGTPVYLLVKRDGQISQSVLFGIPSAFGKSKFVKSLESAVGKVPGAEPAPFPGGRGGAPVSKAGDLSFV